MIVIKKRVSKISNQIILWSLTLLVFLIPLFFLPFNPRVTEFSKQLLLFALVLIAYLAWFAKGIINKKLTVRRTPLDIPILSFLIIYLLATVFSIDRITSILGSYSQGAGSLIAVVFYVLLYFIVVSNINTSKKIIQLYASFLCSLAILVIFVFLQIFNIFILPFEFTKINSFNPVGSISSLVVFLSFAAVIATAFLLKARMKLIFHILILILLAADLFLLNIINSITGYYLLILSTFILLGFGIAKSKKQIAKKWLVVPGILLIISIFSATLGIPSVIKGNLPSEVSLSRKLSWEIARRTVWSGFFRFLFGSGPETFSYDFSQYRPESFNQNIVWNLRFNRANNAYLEFIATTGILGILAYTVITLITIGSSSLVLIESKKKRKRFTIERFQKDKSQDLEMDKPQAQQPQKDEEQKKEIPILKEPREEEKADWRRPPPKSFRSPQDIVDLKSKNVNEEEEDEEKEEVIKQKPHSDFLILGTIAGWASLLLALFLTSANTTIHFLFWLSLALIMSLITIYRPQEFKKSKLSFKASPKYALLLSFTFVIALSVVTILFTYLGRIYLADIYHQRGLEKNLEQKYNEGVPYFARAIRLNKYRPLYHLSLAQNYLAQANIEAAKGENANIESIQILIANSINQSKKATDMAPHNVNFWEARGQIYENTTVYSNDANEWVIKSYRRAGELEPTNPVFETKLARAYMTNASLSEGEEQEQDYNKAHDALKRAIELKPDYLAAHFYLALVFERKTDLEQALTEIGICYQLAPKNQEVIYELGRISYNKAVAADSANLEGDIDFQRALEAFKLVININPNHANAHYSLGLAYETLGEDERALDQMKIVQNLNPDNEQITQKIQTLEAKIAGTSTTEE